LVLRSPDRTASICLEIRGPSPALQPRADTELLRQELLNQFTGARIVAEFPSYTSSHAGRGFDLEWVGAGSVSMASRAACFATRRGAIEFTLTTVSNRFRSFQPVLGGLLTSFQKKEGPAR
jgi:hypothetical protein